ncbi:unnamed protein product [Allacma fusca]|uniref:Uncharacterized protein n=1 Tax=Allacma fusca TaxID=39272 RepID=A0A8J2JT90_9HEXA|nr:unnamed protein product [Allacma fusca]
MLTFSSEDVSLTDSRYSVSSEAFQSLKKVHGLHRFGGNYINKYSKSRGNNIVRTNLLILGKRGSHQYTPCLIKGARQFQRKKSTQSSNQIVPYHGFCSPNLYTTLIYLSTFLMVFYALTTVSAWLIYVFCVPKEKSMGGIFFLSVSSSGRLLNSGILFLLVFKRSNTWIPLYLVATLTCLGLFLYGMMFLSKLAGFSGIVLGIADFMTFYLLNALMKDNQLHESMEEERIRRQSMIHNFDDLDEAFPESLEADSKESFEEGEGANEMERNPEIE